MDEMEVDRAGSGGAEGRCAAAAERCDAGESGVDVVLGDASRLQGGVRAGPVYSLNEE
jgi:hypothetical protein